MLVCQTAGLVLGRSRMIELGARDGCCTLWVNALSGGAAKRGSCGNLPSDYFLARCLVDLHLSGDVVVARQSKLLSLLLFC